MLVAHIRHDNTVLELDELRLVHLLHHRVARRPRLAHIVGVPHGIVLVRPVVADEDLRREKTGIQLPNDRDADHFGFGVRGPRRRRSCAPHPPSR